ncbi:MAG: serine hydrolase domain-containing protein [Bacteroidota bacterium]
MIRIMTIFILIAMGVTQISCTSSPEGVDELMLHYEKNGRRKINSPFMGAVLVAKNGEVIFKDAYGYENREKEIENQVQTIFPVGSITKQFTAMLVMQMVEDSLIRLDSSVATYLPFLPDQFASQMTVHQLLSHTAGLPHYEGFTEMGINLDQFRDEVFTPRQLSTLISSMKLRDAPGTGFHYSSPGYMLLGNILEEVSGKSYAQLIEENIAKPLGLKNTGFAGTDFIASKTARGHRFIEDESIMMLFKKYGGGFKPSRSRDQSNKYATGGIHSTVEDLFIWSEAVRKSTLLHPETTKKMLTPNREGYCYGWLRNWDEMIERNTKAKMYIHGGALSGHRSSIALFDDGTTIIFLANVAPVKETELIHQLYLAAHHLKDEYRLQGYPDRGSLEEFESEGGLQALKAYFDQLSELSGYHVLPSESSIAHLITMHYEAEKDAIADSLSRYYFTMYNPSQNAINRLGYRILERNCEIAVSFFEKNTTLYPDSPNAWDSKAEGLLKCKKYQKAFECAQRAVSLAKDQKDGSLSIFEERLTQIKKILEGR